MDIAPRIPATVLDSPASGTQTPTASRTVLTTALRAIANHIEPAPAGH